MIEFTIIILNEIFVEGERRFWTMSLTLLEGALLPLHEQLMNVPEEPLYRMDTAPPYCLYRSKRNKEGCIYTCIQNECQKNIFHERTWTRKKSFGIRWYEGHIICILSCFLRDFYAQVYSKYCERKEGFAYTSCCIVFEMNSCEFARTTTDVHSTTNLFVIS